MFAPHSLIHFSLMNFSIKMITIIIIRHRVYSAGHQIGLRIWQLTGTILLPVMEISRVQAEATEDRNNYALCVPHHSRIADRMMSMTRWRSYFSHCNRIVYGRWNTTYYYCVQSRHKSHGSNGKSQKINNNIILWLKSGKSHVKAKQSLLNEEPPRARQYPTSILHV